MSDWSEGGGAQSTVDSDLASHPAAPGLILGIPEFIHRILMLPGFIDSALLDIAKLNS